MLPGDNVFHSQSGKQDPLGVLIRTQLQIDPSLPCTGGPLGILRNDAGDLCFVF